MAISPTPGDQSTRLAAQCSSQVYTRRDLLQRGQGSIRNPTPKLPLTSASVGLMRTVAAARRSPALLMVRKSISAQSQSQSLPDAAPPVARHETGPLAVQCNPVPRTSRGTSGCWGARGRRCDSIIAGQVSRFTLPDGYIYLVGRSVRISLGGGRVDTADKRPSACLPEFCVQRCLPELLAIRPKHL